MGTRGLWAYRWRRRYYTTYNHSDSYPSGLGSSLVARIPSDPAEFAAWLEDLKWQLEGRDDGKDKAPKLDLFAEWTYVIDLDRLVFTVNGRSHIQLDKLPRSTATEEDPEDWPYFSCEWTSALNKNHPASIEPSSPIKPSAEHVALYDAVNASESPEPVSIPDFAFTTCGVLMDQLFRNFCFVYGARIIAEEQPDHPAFLAAARGIVALATWGDFEFTDTPLKENHTFRERSDIIPEWTSAEFASTSTPTHFWHRGVLFVLDSGLQDASQLRGSVGRVAHLWREDTSSHKRPVAFVLTLRDLVQVDLSDIQNVKHTSPLLLAPDDDIDQMCGFPIKMEFASESPGFALLKAVLTPVLPASGSLSGPTRFPLDVLDRVLDWCDTETLDALGETCKTVRALRLNRPRVDIGPYRLLHSHSPPDGVFTALDVYGDTTSVLVGGLRFGDYKKEDGPTRFPLDVLDRVLDWCDTETLDALGETCKTVRALRLNRPRVDIGPYRLLHSHSPPDGVFTALDVYGDTTSVLVGGLRFGDYKKEDGCGYNLRLFTSTGTGGERTGTVAKLIGLSARAVEKETKESVA